MRKLPFLLSLGGLLCLTSAQAQLAHRYSLTDVTDSVAGANGQVQGNATLANGMLTTTGDGNDYFALPTSVGTGITGDFSVETYVTQLGITPGFSSLYSLSSSSGAGGVPQNFLLLNPARGNNNNVVQANFRQDPLTNGEQQVVSQQVGLNLNTRYQITLTYVSSTGLASLYSQGTLIGSATIAAGFSLQSATAGGFDGINGGGPFGAGDGSFNGSTTDFRVYNVALSASQVSALNALGPDASNAAINGAAVPEPSTWAMLAAGIGGLLGLRCFRRKLA